MLARLVGRKAAEVVVVNQFGNRGPVAADRAGQVPADFERADLEAQAVNPEETAGQRLPNPEEKFQGLKRLE